MKIIKLSITDEIIVIEPSKVWMVEMFEYAILNRHSPFSKLGLRGLGPCVSLIGWNKNSVFMTHYPPLTNLEHCWNKMLRHLRFIQTDNEEEGGKYELAIVCGMSLFSESNKLISTIKEKISQEKDLFSEFLYEYIENTDNGKYIALDLANQQCYIGHHLDQKGNFDKLSFLINTKNLNACNYWMVPQKRRESWNSNKLIIEYSQLEGAILGHCSCSNKKEHLNPEEIKDFILNNNKEKISNHLSFSLFNNNEKLTNEEEETTENLPVLKV